MARKRPSKALKETVLNEYNHRCAICGADRPQLHHIDEENSNTVADNLLPLCPNCHLTDQHNPYTKIDIGILKLFRKFKDPAILKPQFSPIYSRLKFVIEIEDYHNNYKQLCKDANELIAIVNEFEMGNFYSNKLKELIEPIYRGFSASYSSSKSATYKFVSNNDPYEEYIQKITLNRDEAIFLIIEMLKYQTWANTPNNNRSQ